MDVESPPFENDEDNFKRTATLNHGLTPCLPPVPLLSASAIWSDLTLEARHDRLTYYRTYCDHIVSIKHRLNISERK